MRAARGQEKGGGEEEEGATRVGRRGRGLETGRVFLLKVVVDGGVPVRQLQYNSSSNSRARSQESGGAWRGARSRLLIASLQLHLINGCG